ncbi:MAG TPA: hypothetical protein VFO69_11830 [Allosphingosinicella sp.]|nr:hypothetical protein [Allosphingosinicella sp.]
MTVEIDGIDIVAAAQAGALIGGIITILVIGLMIYLLVRPPRHVREARRRPLELQENEAEQMLDLMERMESRLEVLERALADHQAAEPRTAEPGILESAGNGRETRRLK